MTNFITAIGIAALAIVMMGGSLAFARIVYERITGRSWNDE